MGSVRYAKSPPDCECLRLANKRLEEKMGKGHRRLDKYSREDGPLRKLWMDTYLECIKNKGGDPEKFIVHDDPNYEPGTLMHFCQPPAEKEKLSTIIVRVWWKPDGQTVKKEPLPDAEVQHAVDRYMKGPRKKTGTDGQAVFSPIKPGNHRFLAWKHTDTYLYEMKDGARSVGPGATEYLDIELKRVPPTTLFVKVVDCKKNPVPDAEVTLGAWSQRHDHPIPVPGITYDKQKTRPHGTHEGWDVTGRAVFTKVSSGKYRALAKKTYKHRILNRDDSERDVEIAGTNDIQIQTSGGTYELEVSHCITSQTFTLKITDGKWWVLSLPPSRPALKKLLPRKIADLVGVSVLLARVDLCIRHVQTEATCNYRSDWALLLKWGASTPGLSPVDHVSFKGKGWSNPFTTPAFVKGKFVDQTSFAGDVGLKLADSPGLGMCMDISFYAVPYPGTEDKYPSGHSSLLIQKLVLADINGLPDLPSIGMSATGTGRTELIRVS